MATPLEQAEAYLRSSDMLNLPGAVLYSGEETLQPGPVYILGLNPGGSEGATLRDSLDGSRRGHNAYLDESWAPGGNPQPCGKSTLQRRVQNLCKLMGLEPRSVPISNLAFTRSTRIETHHDFGGAAKASLPVHEIFIKAIDPQFLLTFGSLKNFLSVVSVDSIESRHADHGSWKAHRGFVKLADRRIGFGNIPHMSVWASDKREHVLQWVIENYKSRKETKCPSS
jgi:hypothetical protein